MVHDLSPIVFHVYGDLAVRWYGLSYILGFMASYFLLMWLAQRQKQGLTPAMVGDFVTYGAIGVLVGGRLGYCLFYNLESFFQFKNSFPYWGVLAVSEGGMSSHGGMIGLWLAALLFSVRHGISQLYLYDLVALCGPVGIFFGRIANFINGELVGRPAPPDFPLGVKFPTDIIQWPKHDFERLRDLGPVIDQVPAIAKEQWLQSLELFRADGSAREIVYGGLNQIIEAIQNGNEAAKNAIAPLLELRHPSQLYGALGEGLFLFLILFIMWRRPRKPGVIACWFVILYAFARIADEQFRMPDAHIGYQLFDLTRGQWLSIGMLLIGLVFLFIWGRRESLRVPGWGRGQNVKIHRR